MSNIRIAIGELTRACLLLGDVHVVAAGSMYATLECDGRMLNVLDRYHIAWAFDK